MGWEGKARGKGGSDGEMRMGKGKEGREREGRIELLTLYMVSRVSDSLAKVYVFIVT